MHQEKFEGNEKLDLNRLAKKIICSPVRPAAPKTVTFIDFERSVVDTVKSRENIPQARLSLLAEDKDFFRFSIERENILLIGNKLRGHAIHYRFFYDLPRKLCIIEG